MPTKLVAWILLLTACGLLLVGCGANTGGNGSAANSNAGPRPPAGYENYAVSGYVTRPDNAIDIFIAYSSESQAYMPDIITNFNDRMRQNINPVTGEALAEDESPVYVWGSNCSALTPNPSPERAFGTRRGAFNSVPPPLLAA